MLSLSWILYIFSLVGVKCVWVDTDTGVIHDIHFLNSDESICPQTVSFSFTLDNRNVSFSWFLNKDFSLENIPLLHNEKKNETSMKKTSSKYFSCFYRNHSMHSALSAKYTRNKIYIVGSFIFNGSLYDIQPNIDWFQLPLNAKSLLMRKTYHLLCKKEGPGYLLFREDYSKLRKKRASVPSYKVGIFMVADYSTFKWYSDILGKSQTDVKNEIKFFFAHIFNELNMIYENTDFKKFSLHIRLKGISIATNQELSSWASDVSNSNTASGIDLLSSFKTWFAQTYSGKYDHGMAFTRINMHENGDASKDGTRGQSYIGGICKFDSVSVIEDKGLSSSALVAAHELAHNLGSYHDGDERMDNLKCSQTDGYLMAPLLQSNKHSRILSPCSIKDIKNTISLSSAACLKNNEESYNSEEINALISEKPGQEYTMEQQCIFLHGETSYFCGHAKDADSICAKSVCYDPETDQCILSLDSGFWDGTSCGNKKWCDNGVCVSNSKAPKMNEDCLFGDYNYYINGDLTCTTFLTPQPLACEIESNRELCCETCAKLETGIDGCRYGDRAGWCSTLKKSLCYHNSETCCQSCSDLQSDQKDCLFGDQYPDDYCNQSFFTKVKCYTEKEYENCCDTCSKWKSEQEDCLYGDRVSLPCSAVNFKKIDCYSNYDLCCETCTRWTTGPKGCEWGDRATNCSASCEDGDKDYIIDCCGTCNVEFIRDNSGNKINLYLYYYFTSILTIIMIFEWR